ncbi:MAG: RNA polymerase sigma factor [Planctomycetota bacterium]
MVSASDEVLVARAQRGDDVAFCVLMQRYLHRLTSYLNRVVKDYHAAQDLAQETFVRAHACLGRLTTTERFRPWLFRIGFHIAVDHLRKQPQPLTCLDDIGECFATDRPHHPLNDSSFIRLDREGILGATFDEIASVIADLPLPYRALIAHRYLEGRSCRQLASRHGWSLANVKIRLHRGRRMLRGQLYQLGRRLIAELAPLRDGYGGAPDAAKVRMKF